MLDNNQKSITFACPECDRWQTLYIESSSKSEIDIPCGACGKSVQLTRLTNEHVDSCCVCRCKDLHQHKDFNKKIGLALFIAGACLAPWTYYISLVLALIIDALLYPFFPWMAVCYKCSAEHRGWPKNSRLDRFNHEIAAHYEYTSTETKQAPQ